MLALLWGLGVFGGEGKASGMSPAWKGDAKVSSPTVVGGPAVVSPEVTHPVKHHKVASHPKVASPTTHPSYV